MSGFQFSGISWFRSVSRVGTFCGVAAMLGLLAGCDPCLNNPCDDGTACNGLETCAQDAGQAVCTDGTAVECTAPETCSEPDGTCVGACTGVTCADGEVCDPADGMCVDCLDDAGCDDGAFCNGDETCDTAAGTCSAGSDPCSGSEVCNEDTDACDAAPCDSADACDDGDLCTDDACVDNVCENTAVDCDDGLFCTGTETCNADTGACDASGDPCAADETCNETDGVCDAAAACVDDAGCDDGVFCNGAETCDVDAGSCIAGALPCAGTGCTCAGVAQDAICAEGDAAAECSCPTCPTIGFSLDQDNLPGSTGNDVYDAPLIFNAGNGAQVASLQTGDIANGLAGDDILNATLNGTALAPTLTGIETLNFSVFSPTILTATNLSGVTSINAVNAIASLNAVQIQTIVDFGVTDSSDAAGNPLIDAAFIAGATTGTTDVLDVSVSGMTGGDLDFMSGASNGFEICNLTSSGTIQNVIDDLDFPTDTTMERLNILGTAMVNIKDADDVIDIIDGSGSSGGFFMGSGTMVGGADPYAEMNDSPLDFLTGTNGDDTIIFDMTLDSSDAAATTELIDLGDGTDILQATLAASLTAAVPIRNTEELRLNVSADITVNVTSTTGLTNVTIEADAAAAGSQETLTLNGVQPTSSVFPMLNFRGAGTQAAQFYDDVVYTPASAGGSSDTLNIRVFNRGFALNASGTANVHDIGDTAVNATGFETLNIDVEDGPATFPAMSLTSMTSIDLDASSNLIMGTIVGSADNVTTVDATGVLGDLTGVTFDDIASFGTVTLGPGNDVVILSSAAGTTINFFGGAGNDTLTGTGQVDSISGDAGNDTIIGGGGIDTFTGGTGSDTFAFNTIVLAANANNIGDFAAGASADILRFDATTFTDYSSGATVTFATGGGAVAGLTAGVDNVVIRDTAANILLVTPTAGAQAVIGIATDTGAIYYDANGNFTAGPIIIGSITAGQVASLVAANIVIVP